MCKKGFLIRKKDGEKTYHIFTGNVNDVNNLVPELNCLCKTVNLYQSDETERWTSWFTKNDIEEELNNNEKQFCFNCKRLFNKL